MYTHYVATLPYEIQKSKNVTKFLFFILHLSIGIAF